MRGTALLICGWLVLIGCSDSSRNYTEKAPATSEQNLKGLNSFQKVTGEDSDAEKEHWNTLFRTGNYVYGKEPDSFLKENLGKLAMGKVLVTPLEEGRNGVFLAEKGFDVSGVDFSEVALTKARRLAKERGVVLTAINADLNFYDPEEGAFDSVVNIDLHIPKWVPKVMKAVKPGGTLMYTTSIQKGAPAEGAKPRPGTLRTGELKELFKGFEILYYKEAQEGEKTIARLIARKPPASR